MSAPVDSTQKDIDPEQLAEWLSKDPELQVVDVREDYERQAGFIAGSTHIPLVELPTRARDIDGERPVVFYCRVGARSDMAAQAFRASSSPLGALRPVELLRAVTASTALISPTGASSGSPRIGSLSRR